MTKYSKHKNDVKKIKQASKDYGTKSRSNIKENINQMSSSDNGKDSNVRYDETQIQVRNVNPLICHYLITRVVQK